MPLDFILVEPQFFVNDIETSKIAEGFLEDFNFISVVKVLIGDYRKIKKFFGVKKSSKERQHVVSRSLCNENCKVELGDYIPE
mmetsp:Transcript_33063/g.37950  ORF Transcript_33063/g.37950 Transcript_33063/m.37950 type:complete len:83 (-) Transcript_33063:531-779(-)|eukprot:CAMPEP_0168331562 /NCGR_PEP_ID=MMETSP0213-20121227/8408_1 /TAXON_ID=151035 /ORGANISM="Euplotes harpa, Strain FSP1.4" /LENGTH=82 /DNA_ID=CAMNT_0008335363 /DNA_START=2578 /DNA_END=2826 /DNA_ORIENTATION=-